jgi:putative ABC transport system permease protein
VTLDAEPYTVIGVMPAGFDYPAKRELWTPLEYDATFREDNRGAWYLSVIGRLRPAATIEGAAAQAGTIAKRLEQKFPASNQNVGMTVRSLHESTVGEIRTALLVLLGAVGFVLLIACANVANLLLARAAAREGEIAVRAALGAGRGRLLRQLLTESLLLGGLGGVVGLLVAVWGSDFLVSLQPQGVPRLENVRISGLVIAFTGTIGLLTGLLFGIIPAIQLTSSSLAVTLKEGGRAGTGGRSSTRLRGALVIAEMALAVMLLAGAGLLMKSFVRLQNVNPGFRPDQILTLELSLPSVGYEKDERSAGFYEELLKRLTTLPGVRSAGAVMALPLTGSQFDLSFDVAGREPAKPGEEPTMEVRVASVDYFKTMGIPLLRGRGFTLADRDGSPQVVLLSQAAVTEFFPNEDPIGKRIVLGWGRGKDKPRAGGEVVGIVGDVKELGLEEENAPQMYLPHAQLPTHGMDIAVRTDVPSLTLANAVQLAVHELDPNVPIAKLSTMEQVVADSISQPRFYMLLLAAFAGVALLLAAVGIFGVISYAVAQRTREIGIRIALGAHENRVVGMVVRQAMTLAVTGVSVGIVAALVLSRTLTTLLFSLSPTDPPTFLVVAVVLVVVAFVASYVPARRAARVDPVVALRSE